MIENGRSVLSKKPIHNNNREEFTHMTTHIEISDDEIVIYDRSGNEIVRWVSDEWITDPTIIVSIANAINIANIDGDDKLINILNDNN